MSRQIKIIIVVVALAVLAIIVGVYFALRASRTLQQRTLQQAQTQPISQTIQTPQIPQSPQGYKIQPQAAQKPRLKIISSQPVFDYWTSGDNIASLSAPITSATSPVSKSTASSTAAPSKFTIVPVASSTISSSSAPKPGPSPQVSSNQNLGHQVFYFNEQGQILRVRESGGDEMISDREIGNLQAVRPSQNGQLVLVKYKPLNSPQLEFFNIQTKIWQILDNVSAADFSPDSARIAYLEKVGQTGASNLIIKNLAATSTKKRPATIFALNQKDFDLQWIADNEILLVSKPSANEQNEIWKVDVKNKTLSLLGKDRGFTINWAKDGSYGLSFSANLKGEGKLKLIDPAGALKANLNFSTLPEKCAVTLAKIYCAVSYAYSTIATPFLPDDYLKRKVYFSDYLYEIDIAQNSQKAIWNDADPVLDADKLSIFGNQILFVNRYDKKLYSLSL